MPLSEAYEDAKAYYMDLNLPEPDITEMASEMGLDAVTLFKLALREGWRKERARRVAAAKDATAIVPANLAISESAEANDIVRLAAGLFQSDVALIDGRTADVVAYLDDMLAQNALTGNMALRYLKMLTDMSDRVQKRILAAKTGAEAVDKKVQEFLKGLSQKAAAIRAARGELISPQIQDAQDAVFRDLDES